MTKVAEQQESNFCLEAIVQGRQGNVLKSVLGVQNCCFAYKTNYLFDVISAVVAVPARYS